MPIPARLTMRSMNPHDLDADPFRLDAEEAPEPDEAPQKVEIDDLKWVMSNARGRRFVAGLLDRAGVFRSSFSTNALQMAFSEGNRNEGLRLLDQLMCHAPDRYAEMLKENAANDRRNRKRNDQR